MTTMTYEQEVENVVRDWALLKDEQKHVRTGPASRSRIGTILRFIGLPFGDEREITVHRGRRTDAWAHFTFQADSKIVNSIKGAPQFGSLANGTYHILCLWEDARPDRHPRELALLRNFAQGEQGAVIAIYLNPLTGN